MKNIFIFLFFFSVSTFAQNSNKDLNEMHQQIETQRLKLDSSRKSMDASMQQFNTYSDSMEKARQIESNNRNLNGLVSMMKERERKEKQAMWLRIGFGIAILIVGIIGITRKRKVKSTK